MDRMTTMGRIQFGPLPSREEELARQRMYDFSSSAAGHANADLLRLHPALRATRRIGSRLQSGSLNAICAPFRIVPHISISRRARLREIRHNSGERIGEVPLGHSQSDRFERERPAGLPRAVGRGGMPGAPGGSSRSLTAAPWRKRVYGWRR